MLTEFALDNSFCESDSLSSKSTNRTFIDIWKKQGVLVLGEHQNSDYFLDRLKNKIPANVYQDWVYAFSNNKIIKVGTDWKIFIDYLDYSELKSYNNFFKTGITEEQSIDFVKKLPNYLDYCPASSFEILEIDEQHNSRNFNNNFFGACADIIEGDTNDEIWFNKFFILSKYNKNIVIIDHYLLRNFIEDKRDSKKTNIEFILEKLVLNNKKYNITVISLGSVINSNSYNEIISGFNAINLSGLNISYNKIKIISCNSSYFKKIAHDRFIKFDEYVCTLGKGLEVLRDKDTPRCTFNMVREEFSSIRDRINLTSSYLLWEYEFLP